MPALISSRIIVRKFIRVHSKLAMKIFLLFIGFLSADDGHNEDCKDIDIGTKCEYECESVNKGKLNDT